MFEPLYFLAVQKKISLPRHFKVQSFVHHFCQDVFGDIYRFYKEIYIYI